MNKFVLSLILVLSAISSFAQIKTYAPKPKQATDSIALAPYDSTYTFVRGKLPALVGQQIQFLPNNSAKNRDGYTFFNLYRNKYEKLNPLYSTIYRSTKYDALVNKVFDIVGVDSIVDDNNLFRKVDYRLRVVSPEYADTLYLSLPFIHESKTNYKIEKYVDFDEHSFRNVIILGYFEKLRNRLANTSIKVRFPNNKNNSDDYVLFDIESNEPINSIPLNTKLNILDIGVIDGTEYGGLKYILSKTDTPQYYAELNPLNFTGATPITQSDKDRAEWERSMITKYGKTNGTLIIQGRVKIGFTKQMCKEAWGEPESINTSTGSWGSHEQWVYGLGTYLYFDNGRLSSIDN